VFPLLDACTCFCASSVSMPARVLPPDCCAAELVFGDEQFQELVV
jgi:hypothetical protein